MPVFKLTPVAGTETNPQWKASSIRPFCLWVRAADEQEARRAVARATTITDVPIEAEPIAPWRNHNLVECEFDEDKDVASGIIRVRRAPVVANLAEHRMRA